MSYNNVVLNTVTHNISNIAPFSSTTFSLPFVYSAVGNYSFEIKCDIPVPNGVVAETNELNNTAVFTTIIKNCLPNLGFSDCETFDVQPFDPGFPGSVTYVATMSNSGNATANGPIDVKFQLSGGAFYDTQYPGSLTPGQSTVVSVTVPSDLVTLLAFCAIDPDPVPLLSILKL